MKTEVILKRPFMGSEIRQKSKTSLFSATDLIRIGNVKRRELEKPVFNLTAYFKKSSTIEFIEELQKSNERVIIKGRGRNACTWVHPLLFIDLALSLDPKLKVEVYQWLYDELLKHRNNSGESYKKMVGGLYNIIPEYEFHKTLPKIATYIKEKLNVKDWNLASEEQLKQRDRIHENIFLLCSVLKNYKEAVRLGVLSVTQKEIA